MKERFSDRSGESRGYSADDLISIIWDNTQEAIGKGGLLDELFGYIPADWSEKDLGPAADKIVEGKLSNASRTWLNRALRVKADFTYSLRTGRFSRDDHPEDNVPHVILDDVDALFDLLESLRDVVSAPLFDEKKLKHSKYDKKGGQEKLRAAVNDDLALYVEPYRMLENGQITSLDEGALADLADEALGLQKSGAVKSESIELVHQSIYQYMRRDASVTDKKTAIKELASSLESLRPKVKKNLLSDDEKELFKIANQFALRHQDPKQKNDYDKSIWYDWMFQVNLAALVTVIRIIQSQKEESKE